MVGLAGSSPRSFVLMVGVAGSSPRRFVLMVGLAGSSPHDSLPRAMIDGNTSGALRTS